MARIRKGKNPGPAVRLAAKKSRPRGDSEVANGKLHLVLARGRVPQIARR